MQIACPACKTRISVPDEKIKPEGTKVKCGKCSKVFTVKKKSAEKPPAAAPAPVSASVPPAPDAQSELDKLFGEEPPAAISAPANHPAPTDELGLGYSSAPVGDDDSYLGGDNFGAEMGNYKTQLRPMGSGKDVSLFGDADDVDDAPAQKERVSDLFGSADDLLDEPPPSRPAKAKTAAAPQAAVDSLFQDDPPRGKPSAVMPSKENLDDLFGKGLDDDSADDMVNKLLESRQQRSRADDDVADLFGPRDDKPERKAQVAAKLDSLFDDEPDPVPPPRREAPVQARREAPPPPAPGPSAEELAATMKLEPALREEDLPKPPPAKAPEIKVQVSPKRKFPIKAVIWVLLVLLTAGGVAAAIYVPALNKQARELIAKLPLEKVAALFEPKQEMAVVEPIHISTAVGASRLLTGGRGDSIYVVEGTVTNNYPGSRSFIKVQGKLLAEDGSVLSVREVFAGNILNDEEIRGLERVKIDGMLNRSVGGGLQNFNVPTGKTIPYQIVFYDVGQPVQSQSVVAVSSEAGN